MFKNDTTFKVLPSVGADSIKFYISFMIFAQKNYRALWDNDTDGIKALKDATKHFGTEEAKKFRTLWLNSQKTILQNLFEGSEIKMLKDSLRLPRNSSFEKVVLSLYFDKDKDKLINKMPITKANFIKNIKLFDF